jgi:hypothetical protein
MGASHPLEEKIGNLLDQRGTETVQALALRAEAKVEACRARLIQRLRMLLA